MKIQVKERDSAIPFPKLMIDLDDDMIVLFKTPSSGVILRSKQTLCGFQDVGVFHETFIIPRFKDFKGEIRLANDDANGELIVGINTGAIALTVSKSLSPSIVTVVASNNRTRIGNQEKWDGVSYLFNKTLVLFNSENGVEHRVEDKAVKFPCFMRHKDRDGYVIFTADGISAICVNKPSHTFGATLGDSFQLVLDRWIPIENPFK